MKKFRSEKRGANERPTPLARERMRNTGQKMTVAAYEFRQGKNERERRENIMPKVVVCKPGDRNLYPSSKTLDPRRGSNSLSESGQRKTQRTLQEELAEMVAAQTGDVIAQLSSEQCAALEAKFLVLPIEVRAAMAAKYPALSNIGRYIVRQMVREANSQLEKADGRKTADKQHRSKKWSKKNRPIMPEFEGEARFQGGKMILQGGLPELGKNRKH